jgi:hypothetical protein
VRWDEFIDTAPELGRLAREAFEEQHLAILGTIRANGWPRVSPCEAYFIDGELLLGMMRNSAKVLDLRRDARITVVNGQENRIPRFGDVKLYGHAREVTDPDDKNHFADVQEAAIDWRPTDFDLFAVDIEFASYISFGEGRRVLRWTPVSGEQTLAHPEDEPRS